MRNLSLRPPHVSQKMPLSHAPREGRGREKTATWRGTRILGCSEAVVLNSMRSTGKLLLLFKVRKPFGKDILVVPVPLTSLLTFPVGSP